MAKETAITNEKLIAALIGSSSIKDAAAQLGISPRTIYDRMTDRQFKAEYAAAKSEIVSKAVASLQSHLLQAIDTVAEIMTDENTNPAIRLQAAQTILNNSGKLESALQSLEQRIEDNTKDPLAAVFGL